MTSLQKYLERTRLDQELRTASEQLLRERKTSVGSKEKWTLYLVPSSKQAKKAFRKRNGAQTQEKIKGNFASSQDAYNYLRDQNLTSKYDATENDFEVIKEDIAPGSFQPQQSAPTTTQPPSTEAPSGEEGVELKSGDAEPVSDHLDGEEVVFGTVCAVLQALRSYCSQYEDQQYQELCSKADELCSSLRTHLGDYEQQSGSDKPEGSPASLNPNRVPSPSAQAQRSQSTPQPMGESSEYDDDEGDDNPANWYGRYVRVKEEGSLGEVFVCKHTDTRGRNVWIADKDDRGWFIHPLRLVEVEDEDSIAEWFPDYELGSEFGDDDEDDLDDEMYNSLDGEMDRL